MEFDRGEMGSERSQRNAVKFVKTASVPEGKLYSDIPEWLLLEVLIRLPVKLVFRFKLVCKQWLSVISDPSFIHTYVSRALMSPDSQIWTFIDHTMYVKGHPDYELLEDVYSRDLKCPSLYMLRCPFITYRSMKEYFIAGVSNGLVLYAPDGKMRRRCIYNIFNPVTGQRISLPPYAHCLESFNFGFVTHVENGILSSYRVVCLDEPPKRSNMIIFGVFLSEISKWKRFDLYVNQEIYVTGRNPTALNGILHWITFRHGIMAYDPYKKPDSVRFIALPGDNARRSPISSFCEARQGSLRFFEVSEIFISPDGFYGFDVWILNDYSTGDWFLQYRISSADVPYDGSLFGPRAFPEPISFHPFDPDIVYLGYKGIIASFNIKTRKLEAHGSPLSDTIASFDEQLPWWCSAFLFVIPPWPTSITTPSFAVS